MLRMSDRGLIAAHGAIGNIGGPGISAGSEGPTSVRVDWIQPGSPAEEAGVQPGDRIESVDERPVASLGVPALRVMFRRPAEAHRLGIRRGEERLEIVLTTRRLI
jgi:S1-C subfamily serine protease